MTLTAELGFLERYLSGFDERLLGDPEGRRIVTRLDPLAFALLYLPHHLRGPETGGKITLAQIHRDWCEHAKTWIRELEPGRGPRDAYIAPRSVGKSSWWYTIIPLWAAAHKHVKFIAAFSDSATQAETHLATLKHELDTNVLLRADYATLCKVAVRPRGVAVSDNRQLMITHSGFTFAAKGADSASLGLKVGTDRPDVILLDDIEPGESQYSIYQMEKRLRTIEDVILPLRESARVVMCGTTTLRGGLIDQLVRSVTSTEPVPEWISTQGFKAHYYPAIIVDDSGVEQSIWRERWPMEYLNEIRHTRAFAKNFNNQPVPEDSAFWFQEDIKYGSLQTQTLKILSIDPAVTGKATSDRTGLAVVAFSGPERRYEVVEATGVRLRGAALRTAVLGMLTRHPDCRRVIVESNQGGDLHHEILHDLPCKLLTFTVSEKKEVRAARLLNYYQRGRVLHSHRHDLLESELIEFPNGMHDDVLDAVANGVDFIVRRSKAREPVLENRSYV